MVTSHTRFSSLYDDTVTGYINNTFPGETKDPILNVLGNTVRVSRSIALSLIENWSEGYSVPTGEQQKEKKKQQSY